MTEINNIPKHWQIKKLGEVTTVLGDGLHGTPNYSETGEYYFINGNNLCNGKIIIKENTKRVSVEEYNKYKKLLNENTILVSINGTLGNVAFYNNEKVILGKSACYLNVTEAIDKNYLKILISGKQFLNYANIEATGSTIKNVSLKAMREFNIPLPPFSEQQLIVSKIEELLSDLENGKQQLLLAQQQLKVYRQSLLKWAFEGKLTNKNVKDGELPKGWKWVKLGDESLLITKGASPKWQGINYVEDSSQVLFVTSENVRDNYLDVSKPKYLENSFNEKQKRSILQKGDILLNIVGASIGRASIFNLKVVSNINQAVAVIRLKKDVNNRFVTYYLNSSHAKNYYNLNKVDFARANLSLSDVSSILFPLPNMEEQQLIVDELESKLTVCDKIEETISQSLLQAESLKQSILKKAFEGRLV